MDVGKPSPVNRRTPDMEEETGKERNEELIVLVVRKLTQPCLVKLVRCLSTDRYIFKLKYVHRTHDLLLTQF